MVEQKGVSSLNGSRWLGLAFLVRNPLSQGRRMSLDSVGLSLTYRKPLLWSPLLYSLAHFIKRSLCIFFIEQIIQGQRWKPGDPLGIF